MSTICFHCGVYFEIDDDPDRHTGLCPECSAAFDREVVNER